MELQAIVLLLVKSFRMGNFNMFFSALEQVIPWMFALDHTHFSRWLPIFLCDIKMLPHRYPEIHTEFCKGFFAFQNTRRPFSSMTTDQAHEQNIKIINGNGGSISILDNPSALMKWMVCEPLFLELLERFGGEKDDDEKNHHEDTLVFEKNYNEHVSEFIEVIKDFGNLFLVEEDILMNLSTKTLLDAEVRASVRKAKQLGIESSKCYIQNCLTIGRDSIFKTIPKNNLCLFREKKILATQKGRLKTVLLKEECKIFASLYVASQHRDGDLYDFFRYENHAYQPAISEYGKLRKTNKSDYLKYLEECSAPSLTTPEGITAKVLDVGAIVDIFIR
ncbi:uncharacterized protein LOC136084312 [Hydra vulgaris]|uniref:Uncharacterized protein LOC136084312 n=1 Tax=Hydra vulgaris TaxID=6087 RepID=A0ABM4CFF9_HYDVU